MRKCNGNNTETWGFDAIFDVTCPNCGNVMEFFMDEITRTCPGCKNSVRSTNTTTGCKYQALQPAICRQLHPRVVI